MSRIMLRFSISARYRFSSLLIAKAFRLTAVLFFTEISNT
ncbi:hypothetical protein DSUL_50090 [Desulfovibrionales bacterium]